MSNLSAALTHLVPVDVRYKQDPALWRTRFGRSGWCNRGLRDLWQGDVPGSIDVKFAAGRAHQQGARFSGPQQGPLQSPDKVVPEQLCNLSTNLLISQMETDTCLTYCIRHSLFVCVTLGEVRKVEQDERSDVKMQFAVTINLKRPQT